MLHTAAVIATIAVVGLIVGRAVGHVHGRTASLCCVVVPAAVCTIVALPTALCHGAAVVAAVCHRSRLVVATAADGAILLA